MQRNLVAVLECPACHGDLELDVAEENELEVVSGTLHCSGCKIDYPILDAIPDFSQTSTSI